MIFLPQITQILWIQCIQWKNISMLVIPTWYLTMSSRAAKQAIRLGRSTKAWQTPNQRESRRINGAILSSHLNQFQNEIRLLKSNLRQPLPADGRLLIISDLDANPVVRLLWAAGDSSRILKSRSSLKRFLPIAVLHTVACGASLTDSVA